MKKKLKLISINLLVFLIGVLILEFSMRFFFPNKILWSNLQNTYLISESIIPISHFNYKLNKKINFDINGFRSNAHKCKNKYFNKILLVGDSNVEAKFLKDSDSPVKILTDILNFESKKCYEVDVFGVSGWGPDQSFFKIKEIMKQKKYHFVILNVFADNDIGDLLRNNYPISKNNIIDNGFCYNKTTFVEELMIFKSLRKLFFKISGKMISFKNIIHSKSNNSICERRPWINNKKMKLSSREYEFAMAKLDRNIFSLGKKNAFEADRYDIEIACGYKDKFTEWQQNRLGQIFNEFINHSIINGYVPLILIQPSKNDAISTNASNLKKFCSNYKNSNIANFILESINLENKKYFFINLFDDFLDCKKCYGDNDFHWSDYGVKVAMKKIKQHIYNNTSF